MSQISPSVEVSKNADFGTNPKALTKFSFFVPNFCSRNRGMIYGYARVSTGTQDLTGATAQLKDAGHQKIFREKITGTTADRPQLKN